MQGLKDSEDLQIDLMLAMGHVLGWLERWAELPGAEVDKNEDSRKLRAVARWLPRPDPMEETTATAGQRTETPVDLNKLD